MVDIYILLTILTLACFVGYFVVWGVTPALYSPLMSVSNAISGIVIVAAIVIAGENDNILIRSYGLIAIVLASINIFGGFSVSRRMLAMFKKKDQKTKTDTKSPTANPDLHKVDPKSEEKK